MWGIIGLILYGSIAFTPGVGELALRIEHEAEAVLDLGRFPSNSHKLNGCLPAGRIFMLTTLFLEEKVHYKCFTSFESVSGAKQRTFKIFFIFTSNASENNDEEESFESVGHEAE